mgnify:CR=1 FL=1
MGLQVLRSLLSHATSLVGRNLALIRKMFRLNSDKVNVCLILPPFLVSLFQADVNVTGLRCIEDDLVISNDHTIKW